MPGERRLDLAEFHPIAPELDLVVQAPEKLERAIGQPAHDVAAAVETLFERLGKTMDDESLGSQLRAVDIAASESVARDPQFARHPDRHQTEVAVEHGGQNHPMSARLLVLRQRAFWILRLQLGLLQEGNCDLELVKIPSSLGA